MVVAGTVEVHVTNSEGVDEVVATLGPKEVFGERALIQDCERSATIRSQTAVDVVCLPRKAFRTLIGQFPVLESYFEEIMHTRFPELFASQGLQERMDSAHNPPKR
jgi:CRP-like cAMP-binding protein